MVLNAGSLLLRHSSNRMVSTVVITPPARRIRRIACFLSYGKRDPTASPIMTGCMPLSSKSNAVCSTQTCASTPNNKTMGFYVRALSHHSPVPLFQTALRHPTTAYCLCVFAQIDTLTLSSSYPYYFDFGLFVVLFFVLFSYFLGFVKRNFKPAESIRHLIK